MTALHLHSDDVDVPPIPPCFIKCQKQRMMPVLEATGLLNIAPVNAGLQHPKWGAARAHPDPNAWPTLAPAPTASFARFQICTSSLPFLQCLQARIWKSANCQKSGGPYMVCSNPLNAFKGHSVYSTLQHCSSQVCACVRVALCSSTCLNRTIKISAVSLPFCGCNPWLYPGCGTTGNCAQAIAAACNPLPLFVLEA